MHKKILLALLVICMPAISYADEWNSLSVEEQKSFINGYISGGESACLTMYLTNYKELYLCNNEFELSNFIGLRQFNNGLNTPGDEWNALSDIEKDLFIEGFFAGGHKVCHDKKNGDMNYLCNKNFTREDSIVYFRGAINFIYENKKYRMIPPSDIISIVNSGYIGLARFDDLAELINRNKNHFFDKIKKAYRSTH